MHGYLVGAWNKHAGLLHRPGVRMKPCKHVAVACPGDVLTPCLCSTMKWSPLGSVNSDTRSSQLPAPVLLPLLLPLLLVGLLKAGFVPVTRWAEEEARSAEAPRMADLRVVPDLASLSIRASVSDVALGLI